MVPIFGMTSFLVEFDVCKFDVRMSSHGASVIDLEEPTCCAAAVRDVSDIGLGARTEFTANEARENWQLTMNYRSHTKSSLTPLARD